MEKQAFVFVTVGSTDYDALVQTVDTLAPTLQISGIMQIGHGRYEPTNLPYFRFASSLDSYYEQASLVIAHGGLGTTMEVLKREIPLVSVSNPDRYDNHQEDILSTMADAGYLIWCRQLDKLAEAVKVAQAAPLQRYQQPDCTVHLVINEFLAAYKRKSFRELR